MINKFKSKVNKGKDEGVLLKRVLSNIENVRKENTIFTLFPQNTNYSWQGVKSAGISLFPNSWVELPHYYSNSLLSEKSQIILGETIGELGFDQLIFNGFAPYFITIAKAAKRVKPALKVKVIYHGFLAELAGNEYQQNAFNGMISGRKEGVIDSLGFAKKGLSISVNKLFGFNAKEIIYFNPSKKIIKKESQTLQIGALVSNVFRKNFHNMVVAGLMYHNSTVHVGNSEELSYLEMNNRIIEHGFLPHDEFVSLLGEMTVNLHVTFSEASGGQVCSESISQGVPCISSYTSSFFDYDEELKEKLVVQGVDDSWHIYNKLEEVLNDRDYLSGRCIEYSNFLNELAYQRLNDFLSA